MSLFYYFSPEEDAPVQGPLPYEPDDAPWKKSSESGIRKLYVRLTCYRRIILLHLYTTRMSNNKMLILQLPKNILRIQQQFSWR